MRLNLEPLVLVCLGNRALPLGPCWSRSAWERGLCPSVRAVQVWPVTGLPCAHGFVTTDCEKARSARLPGKERSAPARRARRRPPSHPHCPETGPIQCDIPFHNRKRRPCLMSQFVSCPCFGLPFHFCNCKISTPGQIINSWQNIRNRQLT